MENNCENCRYFHHEPGDDSGHCMFGARSKADWKPRLAHEACPDYKIPRETMTHGWPVNPAEFAHVYYA